MDIIRESVSPGPGRSAPEPSFDDIHLPTDLWIEIAVERLDPLDALALSGVSGKNHSVSDAV
jgi:hypothetical protein